jgi:hypothetical protein
LVRYVAPGDSSKAKALRKVVSTEFAKNRSVHDEHHLDALRANAIRALSNYLLFQSARKDPKVKQAVESFHRKHVSLAREETMSNNNNTKKDDN